MAVEHQEGVSNSTVLSNNAVAQSDYDAAVRAIEQTFDEAIRSSAGATDPTRETDESITARMLLEDARSSLLKNLERIVVPTSDDVFGDYVDLFHIVDDDEESLDGCDMEESIDEVDPPLQQSQTEEIDPADLLDVKALQEAKELREAVRGLSQRIQETRERVLGKAVEPSQSNRLLEEAIHPPSIATSEANFESELASTESLASSMEALSKLLRDSEWSKIPSQLGSLQSTMEVIEKETDKERPMSQTEAAIISRTNSSAMDDERDEGDGDSLLSRMMALSQPDSIQDEGTASATDRLAQFFEYLE